MRRILSTIFHRRFVLVSLTLSLILGCPSNKKTRTNAQALGAPAMELRKAVSFPLATPGLPATRDELSKAITDGLRGHIQLADGTQTIVADGDANRYPHLKRLQIDLTNAAVNTGNKTAKLQKHETPAPGVRADHFQFRAEPLNVDGGHINMNVQARDVALGIIHDRDGQPVLSLDDARDGQVTCQTTMSDLSTIFRASANERGKPFGLSVQKAKLDLASTDERELTADLRLASHLIIVPIQLHFTAHVAVDEDGNATLTNLACQGDDAAGTLITQFIRPALSEYNNKTMPLVGFPSPRLHLHDVRVKVDGDTVRLAAAFGS